MTEKLIIHLGFPKTGTTSLQNALREAGCDCVFFERTLPLPLDARRRQLLSSCKVVFISNEEVIFGALRPRRSKAGFCVLEDWRVRVESYLSLVTDLFPSDSVEIIYAGRDLDAWLRSAFAQNFDSHYWLDSIGFEDYRVILENEACEILDVLRGKPEVFNTLLGKYGRPVRVDADKIFDYLGFTSVGATPSVVGRMNNRSLIKAGSTVWRTKPITFGQAVAKGLRQCSAFFGSVEVIFLIFDRVFSRFPFRSVTIGYFEIRESGEAKFFFRIGWSSRYLDGQPIGLISARLT